MARTVMWSGRAGHFLDEAPANVDPENEQELMREEGINKRFIQSRELAAGWKL